MRQRLCFAAASVLLCACATTTTRLAPVAPEAVRAEEAIQRELVLLELGKAQERLDDIAAPLLVAASPLCTSKTGPRLGLRFRSALELDEPWRSAARSSLQLSDTVTVASVTQGSPAASAGIVKGDRVRSIDGASVPPGKPGLAVISKTLEGMTDRPVTVAVERQGTTHNIVVTPTTACNLGVLVIVEGDINAYADGKNVIFPWAMMRFANDDELRAVVAHEIAHNAMGHIEARKKNAILAGLFGAVADIALATQGYNSGGENTANFMQAGAAAFSQDFEREADYVGMYIMARAGLPLTDGPNLWRQFAQINPKAIGYASTHPTTAERFVRLRAAIDEIETKQRNGANLMPEMKTKQ